MPMKPVPLLVVAAMFVIAFHSAVAQPASRTIIQCGTLLDPGVHDAPLSEQTIVVQGERVVSVEAGFSSGRVGDEVIDLRDAWCMPGLIDSHTHIGSESKKDGYIDRFRMTATDQVLRATLYARATLMAGFTTIRDLGGHEGIDLSLKKAVEAGHIIGPRMFVAGKSMAVMGGHADPTNGYREDLLGVPGIELGVINGVDEAVRGTRLAIKRGADVVKITATGGVLSLAADGSGAHFKENEIRAVVETARDHGRKVAAHAHGDEGMQRAIRAGVTSIEHGTYMSDETMALMKEHGTYYVPTIVAGRSVADSAKIEGYYVPVVAKKALEVGPVIQGTFARAYRAGVKIAFGTDAGVFKHGRNWMEFLYMHEAGMPVFEIIRTATWNAADLLGQLDHLGTLEPGKYADVIAVPRDPLQDPGVMGEVEFVMKAGRVYKRDGRPLPFGS